MWTTYDSKGRRLARLGDTGEITLDFGSTPVVTKKFSSITINGLSATGIAIIVQSGDGAGTRSDDENEMDPIVVRCVATGLNTATIYATALDGPVIGSYKFNYTVGVI